MARIYYKWGSRINFGFKNQTLNVASSDGQNVILLEPLIYVRKDGITIRNRAGATSDGLSTPRIVWDILPPFGKPWFSGIIHDGGYRGTLEILTPAGNWMPLPLAYCDEAYCDSLIKEAMESQGVNALEVETIFVALKECGWRAFDEDRKKLSN